MPNENDELVLSFVEEANESLADMENDLLAIEESGTNFDSDLVNKVFRGIHSMKGSAGFLGLKSVSTLAHESENVLNLIRNHELAPTSRVINALLKSTDVLRGMVNNIRESNSVDVSGYCKQLKDAVIAETSPQVQESLNRDVDIALSDGRAAFVLIKEMELSLRQRQGCHIYVLEVDFFGDVQAKGLTPLGFLKKLYQQAELVDSYMSTAGVGLLSAQLPDSMMFMILAGSKQSRDELAAGLGIPADRIYHIATPKQIYWEPTGPAESRPVKSQPEPAKVEQPAAAPAEAPAVKAEEHEAAPVAVGADSAAKASKDPMGESHSGPQASLRVNVKVLDTLMNLAGELVLGRNQLLQETGSKNYQAIESVATKIDQVTSELQEAIMQTRMQPIGAVFSKFPRIVRDLAGKLGKQCDLTIEGKDVEMDKTIIEAIGDPLTHLIRNSVDHGVEDVKDRTAKGKKACGMIMLRAFHQAGKVNISITDDGAGIDAKKIKEKAVSTGFLTPEQARLMSERDTLRLIFQPGFSMAKKVTDVSGRGVGMDVVKTNIEKLGGTVEIDTELGSGTTISIKLPLTLAIIPSLIVRCGQGRYAIPQVNINELVRIKADEVSQKIDRIKQAEMLRLRGSLLPLVRLKGALDVQVTSDANGELTVTAAPAKEKSVGATASTRQTAANPDSERTIARQAMNIIVVETGRMRYGLVVDELFDSKEIVVKPLGRHMKTSVCLAGATILGDGKVALILDVAGIASHLELAVPDTEKMVSTEAVDNHNTAEKQAVLIFTNAATEYFAIPNGYISRIERIRGEQIDTVGGREVLQYRGATLPLIGLEKYIKALPRPELTALYVVVFKNSGQEFGLIAPTLVDICEISTALDTTTFREKGVIGSVIYNDKTIRLIDVFELAGGRQTTVTTSGSPGISAAMSSPAAMASSAATTSSSTETQSDATASPEHQSAGKQQKTILLAEDSGFFRQQITNFLQAEGYNVIACEDGMAAWETLQTLNQPLDLILTDIEMPRMNGLELSAKIKKSSQWSGVPVIAVTSLASEEDIKHGREAGIDEYKVKLDRDELLETVARYCSAAAAKN